MAQKYETSGDYDYLVTISTDFGDIKLLLFEDTPLHRENFLMLIDKGIIEGTIFHRVINNFMIQGGDTRTNPKPLTEDQKLLIKNRIPAEILSNHLHKKGALAGARQGDQVNPYRMSSSTQFYIVQNPNGTPHLDGAYTVFGQTVSGLDVVDKIAQQPTGAYDRPQEDIRMSITYQKVLKTDIIKEFGFQYH